MTERNHQSFPDLKKTLEACWDELQWRHHGTGMLQAYVPRVRGDYQALLEQEASQRVHIWHRSLVKPHIGEAGAKHNHRFHMRSRVLHGWIFNTELWPTPDEDGDHYMWRIGQSSGCGPGFFKEDTPYRIHCGNTKIYLDGACYALLKWDFHYARPPEDDVVAVTLVDMVDKEGPAGAPAIDAEPKGQGPWARTICGFGRQPIDAFSVKPPTEDQISHYRQLIERARVEMFEGGG